VLGIIPGSMADPGYLVRGRGNPSSLSSASHGAGRAMGRRVATETISRAERDRYLAERRVTLLGGGMDEVPQAYKRIGTSSRPRMIWSRFWALSTRASCAWRRRARTSDD